jgi:hypothetical protein
VFRALQSVEGLLKTIFAKVADPFPEERRKGGSNLSVGKIEMIQKMYAEGKSVAEIAEAVKTTKQTVYRRISGPRERPPATLLSSAVVSRDAGRFKPTPVGGRTIGASHAYKASDDVE